MNSISRRSVLVGIGAASLTLGRPRRAHAARNYGVGVTDTEIKLGTTAPYSGPASSFGIYGQAQTAYFKMINDQGGINGRQINLISLDNAYVPAKAVEQTRRLVEGDEVFAIAGFLGTSPNAAVQKYLHGKKVPNLFLTSGAERFNDPKEYPWTIPLYPLYVAQSAAFGRYILAERPNAKIAVQYLNDDLGKDFLRGLKIGLGDKAASMIVSELSHEIAYPTIDNQVAEAKASGADVFVQLTTSKFAAQGIRKAASLDWKPLHILNSNSASVGSTIIPAGAAISKGVITAGWEVIPSDPEEQRRPAVRDYVAFQAKYLPNLNIDDNTAIPGYNNAFMIAEVLKRCGDELTRENLIKHATSLKNEKPPLYLDGVKVFNSGSDYRAVHNLWLRQFDGKRFVSIGELVDLDAITI